MIINHNIAALNTLNNLSKNTNATQKSLQKLSSGLRINSASDDAAGLAISEKMKGQIRGLDQATRNAQDSISLIQTAEGSLNETHDILQRMRELAVQSSNDTNTADDREEIQKEVNQLKDEIDRISNTTEFNTKKLLNGNIGSVATVSGTNAANVDTATVVDSSLKSGTYTLAVSGVTTAAIGDQVDAGTGLVAADVTLTGAAVAKNGTYQLKVEDSADNAGKKTLSLINTATGDVVESDNNVGTTGSTVLGGITVDNSKITGNGTFSFDIKGSATFTLTATDGTTYSKAVSNYTKPAVEIAGVELGFNADLAVGADTTVTIVNNSLQTQIGANQGQTMNVAINDMSASALGVDNLDLTTASGAEDAITTIDAATKTVSSERAKLGAYENRLDHSINNLTTSSQNLTAAQSRITDVDMAAEMSNFTKNNILNQAAQAMLAQANQLPQGVLQLLR